MYGWCCGAAVPLEERGYVPCPDRGAGDVLARGCLVQAAPVRAAMRAGSMDWHFIRSSAAVGAAHVAARALGILFSFVVAKLYAPAQFGEVRYLIALATVLVIPTNALPRTLSRFVTKHRTTGQDAADCYFSHSVVLLVASIVAVLALALVAALTLPRLSIGLFALCTGLSLFAVYFEL